MDGKRKKEREEKRKRIDVEGLRKWNSSLVSSLTSLKEMAQREWNFEKFYAHAKRHSPSVTREQLQEFMREYKIALKNRPKASGKVV